jgi:putative RecB family exonuclease
MVQSEKDKEILKNMVYSYSSVSSFDTCPLSFKLMYLDKMKRESNIFGELGNATHSTFEAYFRDEAEIFELKELFLDNCKKQVKTPAPDSLLKYNYEENNINLISEYFSHTELDKSKYEVLCIEDKIEYEIHGIKIVIRPDLIVRRIEDEKVLLFDYKTSKYSKDSHAGYAYQCSLYKYIFEIVRGIHIDEMWIIYVKEKTKKRGQEPKDGKTVELLYDEKVMNRFLYDVSGILAERDWKANLDQFFCNSLCSVRKSCKQKEYTFGI